MQVIMEKANGNGEWDGQERRAGIERRSGWDRRGNCVWENPLEHGDGDGSPPHRPTVRTWGDIQAMVWIVLMAIAGVAWGLKLEYRMETSRDDYKSIESHILDVDRQLAKGILPLTEERMTRMASEAQRILTEQDRIRLELQEIKLDMARARLSSQGIKQK